MSTVYNKLRLSEVWPQPGFSQPVFVGWGLASHKGSDFKMRDLSEIKTEFTNRKIRTCLLNILDYSTTIEHASGNPPVTQEASKAITKEAKRMLDTLERLTNAKQ